VLSPEISRRPLGKIFWVHARIQPVNWTCGEVPREVFRDLPGFFGGRETFPRDIFPKMLFNPLTKLSKTFGKLFIKKFYKKKKL
jgi:hypothetical protein